jgi:hypothetical protein
LKRARREKGFALLFLFYTKSTITFWTRPFSQQHLSLELHSPFFQVAIDNNQQLLCIGYILAAHHERPSKQSPLPIG